MRMKTKELYTQKHQIIIIVLNVERAEDYLYDLVMFQSNKLSIINIMRFKMHLRDY